MTTATLLTEWQQEFVLNYIHHVMDENSDRYPHEVVEDQDGKYKGDWDKYVSEMAEWHNIEFCSKCEKVLQAPRIQKTPNDRRWCHCSPNQ